MGSGHVRQAAEARHARTAQAASRLTPLPLALNPERTRGALRGAALAPSQANTRRGGRNPRGAGGQGPPAPPNHLPLRAQPPDPTGALPIGPRDHVRGAQPRGPICDSSRGWQALPCRGLLRSAAECAAKGQGWGIEGASRRPAAGPVPASTASHASGPSRRLPAAESSAKVSFLSGPLISSPSLPFSEPAPVLGLATQASRLGPLGQSGYE
jgi:hypothetical protein